jgi:hypothetical protein
LQEQQKQTAWNAPDSYISPKFLPENERHVERCNMSTSKEEKGFIINGHCTAVDDTCSNLMPYQILKLSDEEQMKWVIHPQRLSICQNLNFWQERRMHSRDNNDNYFNTCTLLFELCQRT